MAATAAFGTKIRTVVIPSHRAAKASRRRSRTKLSANRIGEVQMANDNPGHGGGNPGQGGGPAPVTIYVNGTPYEVAKERISYEELLALINAPALPEDKRYSVQYSKGHSGKPT